MILKIYAELEKEIVIQILIVKEILSVSKEQMEKLFMVLHWAENFQLMLMYVLQIGSTNIKLKSI